MENHGQLELEQRPATHFQDQKFLIPFLLGGWYIKFKPPKHPSLA